MEKEKIPAESLVKEYCFHLTPIDPGRIADQTVRCFEKRREGLVRNHKAGHQKTDIIFLILSLLLMILGAVLLVLGLRDPADLWFSIFSGTVGLAAGISGLFPVKLFAHRYAEKFLKQSFASVGTDVIFTEDGICFPGCKLGYDELNVIMETEDLYVMFCGDRVVPLQKKDLRDGDHSDFKTFLYAKATAIEV